MSEKAQRFSELFSGFTARYGRYDLPNDNVAEGEKAAGVARTVDREITLNDYSQHVLGRVGIGVIPLREDNRVNFAAIDIDLYKRQEQQARKLRHEDVALALFETPLVVTRSKSNGIHVWLFSSSSVNAQLAVDYLQMQASALGAAGSEVFPKQTKRIRAEDIGNWINLPYFGASRRVVYPIFDEQKKTYSYPDLSLEKFLDIAENASQRITDSWLHERTKVGVSQRGNNKEGRLWHDGPPCLQKLIAGEPEKRNAIETKFTRGDITKDQRDKQIAFSRPQLQEGNRNVTFFNTAIYLRRRLNPNDPDSSLDSEDEKTLYETLIDVHTDWRHEVDNEGIRHELKTIAKQVSKGKWSYSCTKEPLKEFCNRKLCLKRRFGIGTATNDISTSIDGFTIVNTRDKQYFMNVNGVRVYIPNPETLLSQTRFAVIILNDTNMVWKRLQDNAYTEMITNLIANADIIAGPPDSDHVSITLNCLDEFVRSKKIIKDGKRDNQIFTGRVLLDKDETVALFKLDQFLEYLRSRGHRGEHFTTKRVANTLVQEFKAEYKNTTIAGRHIRPYQIEIAQLDKLVARDLEDNRALLETQDR